MAVNRRLKNFHKENMLRKGNWNHDSRIVLRKRMYYLAACANLHVWVTHTLWSSFELTQLAAWCSQQLSALMQLSCVPPDRSQLRDGPQHPCQPLRLPNQCAIMLVKLEGHPCSRKHMIVTTWQTVLCLATYWTEDC
jgi:hypothetical protein